MFKSVTEDERRHIWFSSEICQFHAMPCYFAQPDCSFQAPSSIEPKITGFYTVMSYVIETALTAVFHPDIFWVYAGNAIRTIRRFDPET